MPCENKETWSKTKQRKTVKYSIENFKTDFFVQNNKSKKYENPLAPTDFVTKEVVWFWLDNFDSQTFHSWVGFA